MGRELPDRMNYQDAGLLNFDRDRYPHNAGSVGIYEGRIDFDDFLAHVQRRLDFVPRYRQRVVRVPFDLARPAWHDDPDFDIHKHVRRVRLPGPSGDEQLAHLAGEYFATPLKRDRPLWEILLVEGLSDNRTAHLMKAHHSMVDGVSGVALLVALLDMEPNPKAQPRPVRPAPEPIPDGLTRLVDGAADLALEQIDMAERAALGFLEPMSFVRWTRSVASSLRAAAPKLSRPAPEMPWNTRLTAPRRLAWQQLPFEGVREVKTALGGTVNDVVLAVLAGGIRAYLLHHGERVDGTAPRVVTPVNVRSSEEEQALGNRVSLMLAGLPIGVDDPAERFNAVHREMSSLKAGRQAEGLYNLMGAFGTALPAQLQSFLGARLSLPNPVANLVCTNVPGPLVPLYCLGHRIIAHYPWVLTTWRMGLSVAVMSYDKGLYFSFTGDVRVLPDLQRLADYASDAFTELYEAATGPRRRASHTAEELEAQVAATDVTDGLLSEDLPITSAGDASVA